MIGDDDLEGAGTVISVGFENEYKSGPALNDVPLKINQEIGNDLEMQQISSFEESK